MNDGVKEAVIDVIGRSFIDGYTLKFPSGIGRDLYQKARSAMEAIGGKWSAKGECMVFPFDPTEKVTQIIGKPLDTPKKKFCDYATSVEVGDLIRPLIGVLPDNAMVLEPQAGRGDLLKAFWEDYPEFDVDVCEIQAENREILKEVKSSLRASACIVGEDFLEVSPTDTGRYALILACPPFDNDVAHVRHMLNFVAPGGQLVSVMTTKWRTGQDAVSRTFRSIVEGLRQHIEIHEIPTGSYAESGSSVDTCVLIFNG